MDQERKPWEKVTDPRYFRQVLGNLVALGFGPKRAELAHTRFGLTGIGHAPHYEIEDENGVKYCFNGLNHKPFADDEFDASNLSNEQFAYADIQAMLAKL